MAVLFQAHHFVAEAVGDEDDAPEYCVGDDEDEVEGEALVVVCHRADDEGAEGEAQAQEQGAQHVLGGLEALVVGS